MGRTCDTSQTDVDVTSESLPPSLIHVGPSCAPAAVSFSLRSYGACSPLAPIFAHLFRPVTLRPLPRWHSPLSVTRGLHCRCPSCIAKCYSPLQPMWALPHTVTHYLAFWHVFSHSFCAFWISKFPFFFFPMNMAYFGDHYPGKIKKNCRPYIKRNMWEFKSQFARLDPSIQLNYHRQITHVYDHLFLLKCGSNS